MDIPIHQAIAILSKIKQLGCTEVVLCPGGRNAPFVEVLSKLKTFNTTTLFEERSAGFYACGLIKKNNQPVAVITTSGTAVAELLPSVIEAYHQGLPLILITADRPKIFRGSGAPQAIEQANILSGFCQKSFDLEDDLSSLKNFTNLKSKPLHINICFDEPLLAGKKESYDQAIMERPQVPFAREEEIAFDIPVVSKPLVILGA